MTGDGKDDDLIRRAADGDARAWETLVRRHEGRLYNHGLRLLGDSSEALDLLQEVFMGAYRNLGRFRGEAQLGSWLFRIAHNKAVDIARKRRLWPLRLESATGDESRADYGNIRDEQAADPEQLALADEASRRIVGMLQGLPTEQRLIVELKVFQSLTFEEIGEMQGISVNTAKTRFYTALRKLRTRMEQDGDHDLQENA